MPKGTIYTSADRATSQYDRALKSGKGIPAARDKAMREAKKRVPTSSVVKRVIYKNGKASTKQGGY